jgi:hypothetical protein
MTVIIASRRTSAKAGDQPQKLIEKGVPQTSEVAERLEDAGLGCNQVTFRTQIGHFRSL